VTLARVLHQSVLWQIRNGVNDRGEAAYLAPVRVTGRVVAKSKDVIAKDGSVTTVVQQVTTIVAPSVGDLLNGREVVLSTALVTVGGKLVGYQSSTR